MSVQFNISVTPASKSMLSKDKMLPAKLRRGLSQELSKQGELAASHIQSKYFTGYRRGGSGGKGLMVRSGILRRSIQSRKDDTLTVSIGVIDGPATKYAAMQLGSESVTITPKKAKWLWIPVAKNLTAGGQMRRSPRDVVGSRKYHIVARDANTALVFIHTGGTYQRGRKKGMKKGYLAFVLKKSVTVQGSAALEKGLKDREPAIEAGLNEAVTRVLNGWEGQSDG